MPSWSPVVCGLWSVLDESVRIQRCAAEMKSQIALPRFSRHVGRFTGTRGFAGDSCRLGEESGVQTHVHRFRTPQSVCSAASIFTTCSKEFGALGAAVVRCPGCAQVEQGRHCCHHAGSAGAGRQPGLRPAIDGCHHRAAYIDNR